MFTEPIHGLPAPPANSGGIHWFGPGGSGVIGPAPPGVGPVPHPHPSANPLAGLIGGQHPIHSTMADAHHGFLASIIHSLLGGGPAAFHEPLGGLAPAAAPAGPGPISHGLQPFPDGELFHNIPATPPPGVTPPPANSYNPALWYRSQGQPEYAAQLWESRHPYAMSHGNIPHWVTQALLKAIQAHTGNQTQPVPSPAPQLQVQ